MSGICEIFPEDPSCAPVEPVEDLQPATEIEGGDGAGEAPTEEMEEGAEEMKGEGEEMEGDMKKTGAHWSEDMGAFERFSNYQSYSFLANHSAMKSNLGMLLVPTFYSMYAAGVELRYHTKTDYYLAGKLGASDTNFW